MTNVFDDLPEVMLIEEAARALRVHPASVRRMCRSGEIECVKVLGRWRVPKSEVLRLLSPVRLAGGRALERDHIKDAVAKTDAVEDQDAPYTPPADQRRLFDGGQHGAGRGDVRQLLTPRVIGM